jgi:NAD/NADP transhydrogenase alpha subunit/aspartate/methionine/tyrosine aminotransferase
VGNEDDRPRGPADTISALRRELSRTSREPVLTSSELSVPSPATSSRNARLRQLLEERRVTIIDLGHGEMRFAMHPQVQTAVMEVTRELLAGNASLLEADGHPFDKSQPHVLRQLAADRLYMRWRKAGLTVSADDVLVCPYSSLAMLEATLASVARPDGVILCPEGFSENIKKHIEKLGLSIRLFPAPLGCDGKVDAWYLRRAIQIHREQLCALLFTMPGNPLIAAYSAEELQAIGGIVVEEGVPVIIDAALDAVVPDYVPLAAIAVDSGGKSYSLFDQTVTIADLSKGHHAVAPYEIGAAITGDARWRADIRRQLAVPLQRETTALARVVLEQTPEEFFEENRRTLAQAHEEAWQHCSDLENRFGFPVAIPIGSSRYGPFVLIRLADRILRQAGIEDGWQLAEFLLGGAGLETLTGPSMGFPEPVVRINVDAPRTDAGKDPTLLAEVFARLAELVQTVLDGKLTYQRVLGDIGDPPYVTPSNPPYTGSSGRSPRGNPSNPHDVASRDHAKIIVLKEDQPGEHRVALTPRASADLVAQGMRVCVESGAGLRAGYKDELYIKAGAAITATRSELFQDADVIAWVKPPSDLDRVLSQLLPGCTIVGLTHPLHNDTVAQSARRRMLHVQSVELLAREGILPTQDALAAMSRFAGRIALEEALVLRRVLGHCGQQNVLIVGAGQAGMQAAQLASVLGHSIAVVSTGQRQRREAEHLLGAAYYSIDGAVGNIADLLHQQQIITRVITSFQPGVIIAAAKHAGEKAPCLLPAETLKRLPGNTVVVDLNATRGGNVAGSQVDRHLQMDNGVWICNSSNYPNAEPAEASSAYAACLVSILRAQRSRRQSRSPHSH